MERLPTGGVGRDDAAMGDGIEDVGIVRGRGDGTVGGWAGTGVCDNDGWDADDSGNVEGCDVY